MQDTCGNMKKQLTLMSLFDGSGGFPLGASLCGIKPVTASEIEPFAIRVTTKRVPRVKHYGDINKINSAEIPPVDVITGGFPCQNLSIAGTRAGLHGERSGLFFQMIRIIKEMLEATDGNYPKYLCFENVPGLLSSNKGKDFCEVMDEITSLGFISDPNILDAADFGVAQRRKRVYIVSINRRFYNPDLFADIPKVRDKRMEKALDLWGGETFYGIASRPYTPVKQRLTEILQSDVDGKYYLSVTACLGIIRRAAARGKELPELLKRALESQAGIATRESADEDAPLVFEPGAASRLGGHNWKDGTPTGTLRADMGDNQLAVTYPINTQVATRHKALGKGTGFGVGNDGDPAYTVQAAHSHAVAVYDARGYGNGEVVGTLVGAHNNRITDYTAIVMNERQYELTVGEDIANTLTGTDYKGTQLLFEPKTLKIRSGCEGGGKGTLIQNDMSATLATGNDQTVFVPMPVIKAESVNTKTYDVRQTSDGTINARHHAYGSDVSRCLDCGGNIPGSNHGGIAVVDASMTVYGIDSKASNSMKSGNPYSGIHEMELSRALDTGACSGNGGQVVVSGSAVCIQGNAINRKPENGPMGKGLNDDISFTLTEVDKHAVCYQEVIGTLSASDHKFPQQQQIGEGKAIVERVSFGSIGANKDANKDAVAYGIDRAAFNQGQNAQYKPQFTEDGITTLTAKGPAAVCSQYIVRRLTPGECALLQGFPLDYCTGLETPKPTEEDISFWADVWEEHRRVMGTSSKPKSRNQIIKWLKSPHTDAAEYKMWGNGVTLNCVIFVMEGITRADKERNAWEADKTTDL